MMCDCVFFLFCLHLFAFAAVAHCRCWLWFLRGTLLLLPPLQCVGMLIIVSVTELAKVVDETSCWSLLRNSFNLRIFSIWKVLKRISQLKCDMPPICGVTPGAAFWLFDLVWNGLDQTSDLCDDDGHSMANVFGARPIRNGKKPSATVGQFYVCSVDAVCFVNGAHI